jgi:hypothetical protein
VRPSSRRCPSGRPGRQARAEAAGAAGARRRQGLAGAAAVVARTASAVRRRAPRPGVDTGAALRTPRMRARGPPTARRPQLVRTSRHFPTESHRTAAAEAEAEAEAEPHRAPRSRRTGPGRARSGDPGRSSSAPPVRRGPAGSAAEREEAPPSRRQPSTTPQVRRRRQASRRCCKTCPSDAAWNRSWRRGSFEGCLPHDETSRRAAGSISEVGGEGHFLERARLVSRSAGCGAPRTPPWPRV